MTIELKFHVPAKVWSVNELTTTRQGDAIRQKQKNKWKHTAASTAIDEGLADLALGPSTIQITIPFKTNRVRDPHNYVGTVCKSIIDGLVIAGVWTDDNENYLTVLEPVLVKDPTETVIVTIKPRSVDAHA